MPFFVHGGYHLKEILESHSCMFLSIRNCFGDYCEHLNAEADGLGTCRAQHSALSFRPLQFQGRNYFKMK